MKEQDTTDEGAMLKIIPIENGKCEVTNMRTGKAVYTGTLEQCKMYIIASTLG